MIHRHRSLLFLLFTASFFIAASSVLFYAYGYRFSFERGIFIYTGSLSLKTNVETVVIKVDNTLISEKHLGILNNSIRIAGLHPGEHFIEVSAPGYKPWSKKIVIQSGLTTEFWNIYLTEENSTRETVPETKQVLKIFPALNGLFATVKKDGTRYSVDVLDIGGKENEEVFATTEAIFSPTLEANIEWSPESHKLIIPLLKAGEPIYAIVDIKTKEVRFLNEAAHSIAPLHAPRWDATTKDFLFFLENRSLYRLDTRSSSTTPATLIAENIAAYDLSGSKLYSLGSDNGLVYEMSSNGNNQNSKQITGTPIAIDDKSAYSLIVYDDTRLSIIEESTGRFLLYNKESPTTLKELGKGIQSIQYSDDGKKLLFYTGNEISVYFNQDWETQPFRVADSVTQVARFSSKIENVQWAEDYEHVIFSLNGAVKMIELDNRDRKNMTDLVTFSSPLLQVLTRFGENYLYFVSSHNEESDTVSRAKFSEQSGLFGL